MISSLGALGGFFGPYLFGYIKGQTGEATTSLLLMAGLALTGALVAASLRVRKTPIEVAGLRCVSKRTETKLGSLHDRT